MSAHHDKCRIRPIMKTSHPVAGLPAAICGGRSGIVSAIGHLGGIPESSRPCLLQAPAADGVVLDATQSGLPQGRERDAAARPRCR